jgi:hypothetical protein
MITRGRLRQTGLSVTLWAFGFATTLLLIGLWGRSASADETTIAESTRAVVTSDLVRDRVVDWVDDGLADAGFPATAVGDAVDRVLAIDEVRSVVDGLVAEAVAALVAEDEAAAVIDVAAALRPAVPLIAAELEVDDAVVMTALESVEPIDLGTTEAAGIARTAAAVHGALTVIAVLAALALVGFGAASVGLSEDRKAMVRGLAIRVALSAFSFALLFQIGGWLIDPDGGRSPILTGSSILIRSNGHVFVIIAVAASVVALAAALRSRRRRVDPFPDRDDTRELAAA